MNLRNKKVIYAAFIGTMVTGLAVLTINPIGNSANQKTPTEKVANVNTSDTSETGKEEMAEKSLVTPSPGPTQIPTPTPLPVYPLQEEGYPKEIDQLIKKYYDAKLAIDIDALKKLSSKPDAVISKENLEMLVEGIDEYLNIKCYVKDSYLPGTYIVYVYYDIKFIGIDTYAPSLAKMYLVTDEDGKIKNFDGEFDEELKAYLDARRDDEDVKKLKAKVEKLEEKAKEKDKTLNDYWNARS